jgi:hypothetical protein
MSIVYYVQYMCEGSLVANTVFDSLSLGHALVALKTCKFHDSRTFGFSSRFVGNIYARKIRFG